MLVTGTRELADSALVHAELDKLQPDMVIHGAAMGVDAAAAEWAAKHGRYVVAEPAQWRDARGKADRSAGAKRNTVMVEFALRYKAVGHEVICLAMPGPRSVGTHDCGRKAHAAGLRIVRVDVP